MFLAEMLQTGGNPIIVPPHPDEVLQAPVPSLSRAVENPNEGQNNPPAPSGDFQIRNRNGNQVNEFLELLSRISNRNSTPNEPGPSGRQAQAQNATEETSESSSDEEQNQGILFIPPDPSTGSRPRFFSFVTQRSPVRRRRGQRRRPVNLAGNSSSPENTNNTDNGKIHHNMKRLTHYIQELNSEQVRTNRIADKISKMFILKITFRVLKVTKKKFCILKAIDFFKRM